MGVKISSELGLLSSPLGQIEAIYQLTAVHCNFRKEEPVNYKCKCKSADEEKSTIINQPHIDRSHAGA